MSLEIPETPSRTDSDYAVANSGKRRSCQFAIQKFQQVSRRVAVAHCAGVAPLLLVHDLIVRVPCDERGQALKTFDLTAQPRPRLTERVGIERELDARRPCIQNKSCLGAWASCLSSFGATGPVAREASAAPCARRVVAPSSP
jgi:hypothetical protein